MDKKVAIFLVDGFEEIEAIAPIDILRRAKINVDIVAITENKIVKSSRNLSVIADKIIDEIDFNEYEMIILPGGPGTKNYYNSELLIEKIKEFSNIKKVAAICAAPTVLAKLGILKNKNAISYPSCENQMLENGVILLDNKVVVSNNIITSKSAGTAIDFALEIVKLLLDENKSLEIKNEIVY